MEVDHQPEGMEEVAIEKVAVEKLMAKVKLMEVVMEVAVTKKIDMVYNYTWPRYSWPHVLGQQHFPKVTLLPQPQVLHLH